jgi:hypothetical protein
MTKHRYTEAEAPTNTGSLDRPARFNLRLTCSARARTIKAFDAVRELTGMDAGAAFADVWEDAILPAVEHVIWNAREAPRGTRNMMLDLFKPLAKEDYVRARYERLKERFGKQMTFDFGDGPQVAVAR